MSLTTKIYINLHSIYQLTFKQLLDLNSSKSKNMNNSLIKSVALGMGIASLFAIQHLFGLNPEQLATEGESERPRSVQEELFGPDLDESFFYSIGPRFGGIKKSAIMQANKLEDLLDPDFTANVKSYERIELRSVDQDGKFSTEALVSEDGILNEQQLNYLQKLPYGSNINFKIDCYEYYQNTSKATFNTFTPYLTVIPEQQAGPKEGIEAFIKEIRIANYPNVAGLSRDDLRPAKLFLTINEEGLLNEITLDKGTGYPQVDLKLIDLLKKSENEWYPARNAEGKALSQTLVFFFGLPGC